VLDQLRRHASSWIVKAVLTTIILTFIFFFGYSRVANRYQDTHMYAATVGERMIPRKKYENMVQSSLDRMRSGLNGEVPENLTSFLRQNVLNELILREVTLLYAANLGLEVGDQEIASAIRANKSFFPNGDFDLAFYEKTFLPQYRQRYGEEFEDTVRRDLLVEKMRVFAGTLFDPWKSELDTSLQEGRKLHASKKKGAETAETQASESPSPQDLLTSWLDEYKNRIKVHVFETQL
jgi:peptidyl-prolyl cis-trans isomerase D